MQNMKSLEILSLKVDVSIKSLPSKIREFLERGGLKRARAKGEGKYQEDKTL